MLKAAWLLPLLFLVLPGLVLGSDDGSLWMEAKPLHGRMVFVRLSAPTPTWEKHYHDRDLIVYVGTKPGDPPVRRADVAISAKDGKGNPVKAEWVEDAQYKGRYSHTYAPGRPDMGDYNFHLRDGRGIASIRVTWRGHRQTFFTAQGLKGLDWKVAEGWLGYVEKPVETYTLSIADDVLWTTSRFTTPRMGDLVADWSENKPVTILHSLVPPAKKPSTLAHSTTCWFR